MSDTIKVVICSGTACYVMGASDILLLEEELPASLRERVQIEGCTCLGYCKDSGRGKAPFVEIDGVVMSSATLPKVIARIRELADA